MGIQKFRSKTNYAQILGSDREGIATGLDAGIFLRKEASPRSFNAPRVGTSGASIGAITASTDISAGTNDQLGVAVDGNAPINVTLTLAGLSTGVAIEAELETAINTALIAAGLESRVWVNYDSGDDHYEITSQATGVASSVVVVAGAADDVTPDLKLGIVNSGTENVGTDDQDFLLYTTGGFTHQQPVESNAHRSGRFHSGILKKKIVAEFEMETYLNMSGAAGESIDTAVMLLLESIFGNEEVVSGQHIKYTQGLPNLFFSAVSVGTIHGEYYTGGYAKNFTLTVPGDAPATMKFDGMAQKGSIAGIGQVNGLVSAVADVVLQSGHAKRYATEGDNKPRVMLVDVDGVTILDGMAGDLYVDSVNVLTETLTLNRAVDAADLSYVAPWNPGAVQATGRDNIYTDLQGYFKFSPTGEKICTTNIELAYNNDHIDLNNCFGSDANLGFSAANRATISLSVTVDLSNQHFGELVQARKFEGFNPVLVIGDENSGRYAQLDISKYITEVPPIDLPENGTVPVTFSGTLYQSTPGAKDPLTLRFR